MAESAFLDRGVVLGYCFTVKQQHRVCREYLAQDAKEFYVTQEVESIYDQKKRELTEKYSDKIRNHGADLTRSKFDGELGPMELKEITNRIVPGSGASGFLEEWYIREVPQIISMYRLKQRLRDLARDIERLAEERKDEFDDQVALWERERDYPNIRDQLEEIEKEKEEDVWICIDAHDLATRTDGYTELATTDLSDFIRGGRKRLILESTDLDEVVPIAEDTDQRT